MSYETRLKGGFFITRLMNEKKKNEIVLFGRDVKTIGKHINNALKEELDDQVVVAKFATTSCNIF